MNNKTRVRFGLAAALAAGALATSLIAADPKPKRAAAQTFMRMKLAWSQAALEGLTLERFDVVSRNAIRMRDMTHSNQWFTMRQPDYMAHTTNYQKRVNALYMAAVDKKLDAATEAYVEVTRSCVECHRLLRTEQRKNASLPTRPGTEPDLRPGIVP